MSIKKGASQLVRAVMPLTSDLRRFWSPASIAGLGILVLASLACTLPTNLARDTAAGSVTPSPIGDNLQLPVTQIRAHSVTITPRPTATKQPTCTVSTGVKDGTVNIRSGPGMEYPVNGWTWEGSEMPVTGEIVNGWQMVAAFDGWFYVDRWCER